MLDVFGRPWVALTSGFHVSRTLCFNCFFLGWRWALIFALKDAYLALAP
jgi:hypothetical protein